MKLTQYVRVTRGTVASDFSSGVFRAYTCAKYSFILGVLAGAYQVSVP
jgi:hypothetical protein